MTVDLSGLGKQLSHLGLMALVLCLQEELAVDHEPAIVVDNRDAVVGVQLILGDHLSRPLDLQEV